MPDVAHRFVRTFKITLATWSAVLVLWVIPLYVLHGLDGYLEYMRWAEVAVDVSFMMLIAFVIAALAALLTAALSMSLPGKASILPEVASAITALSLGLFFTVRAMKLWIEAMVHMRVATGVLKPMALAACLIVLVSLIRKLGVDRFLSNLNLQVAGPARITGAILAAAALVVLFSETSPGGAENAGYRRSASSPRSYPNVILITIDTLAADEMSVYGYALDTTPALRKFAAQSYVFENAFSNCNFTTPAVASILTGKYATSHGIYQLYGYLRKGKGETLPALLREHGYQAASIVSSHWAHPLHIRFDRSFDYVADPVSIGPLRRLMTWLLHLRQGNLISTLDELFVMIGPVLDVGFDSKSAVPPELVYQKAIAYLDAEARRGPVFLWTHVSPPHEPYLPPRPYRYQFLRDPELNTASTQDFVYGHYPEGMQPRIDRLRLRYDEYIAYTDHETGRYLDYLREHGYFANSIIILTADHGQSFRSGYYGHAGPFLYESLIHIPLLVHTPGQIAGTRVSSYAEQADIASTVLDLISLPAPNWMQGESLKNAMQQERWISPKPKFATNLERNSVFEPPTIGTVAVMQNGYKYVRHLHTGEEELYALNRDREETNNLEYSEERVLAEMRGLAESHLGVAFGIRKDKLHLTGYDR